MNQTSEKTILTGKERAMRWGIGICIFFSIIFVVLGFLAAPWGFQAPRQGADRLADLGSFGSYLQGTTASLWSLAGLLIIFVAFLAQQQQLTLQQRQFQQQSFESHFFQLLIFHNGIVDDLKDRVSGAEGRNVFSLLYSHVKRYYREGLEDVRGDTEAVAVFCYETVFNEHPEMLGHYFRNLYHIMKFVDESGPLDKKRYASIVRAQLSSYEHVFLHYNGLSAYGNERFKPLIEKYALLENMGPGLLMNPKHPTSYSKSAFGEDAALFVFLKVSPPPAQSPPPVIDSKPA